MCLSCLRETSSYRFVMCSTPQSARPPSTTFAGGGGNVPVGIAIFHLKNLGDCAASTQPPNALRPRQWNERHFDANQSSLAISHACCSPASSGTDLSLCQRQPPTS